MKRLGTITILGLLSALAACTHNAHYIDIESPVEGLSVTTTPDSNQATYIKTGSSDIRFCAETNIDYADSRSSGISTSIGVHGVTDSLGDKSTDSAVGFGGRDPAVLITRELMFRACEFMANINADDRTAVTIYAGTLDAIIKISQSQQGMGTSPSATPRLNHSQESEADSDASASAAAPASSTSVHSSAPFDWSSAFDYSDTYDSGHP